MIEVLSFLARRSKPDIRTAVEKLSQFSNSPTRFVHPNMKLVFGYLESTCNFGLVIPFSQNMKILKFYFDFDFASDKTDRSRDRMNRDPK